MNIYFAGIGGVGIGPLAEIAYDAGYHVQGSEISDSPVLAQVINKGINIGINQDGKFLRDCHAKNPIDWYVHSSAIDSSNPEYIAAQQLGIRIGKRDELLAHIIKEKNLKLIAVAGTHGKTTTTGMLIWLFKQLNIPISYSIGTTINYGPSGHFDNSSEYFIYECDEYDRNFLHFKPYLSVITSVDYDHPDSYPDEKDYDKAFKQFVGQSRRTVAWSDQKGYIFDGIDNVWLLTDENYNKNLQLAGVHNRRNGSIAQIAMDILGLPTNNELVNSFPGTDRRFEKLADNLYSDYGHHPVEIAATLQLASEISDNITLVYQPHQNLRQATLQGLYSNQFELAKNIYWLPTYLSREKDNVPIIKPETLIENITNKKSIHIADFNEELWQAINAARQNKSLVLVMGAGTIDSWVRTQLKNDKINQHY